MTKGLKIALIAGGVAAVVGAATAAAVVALKKCKKSFDVLVIKDDECDCGCDCADENTCKYCSCMDCEEARVGGAEVVAEEVAAEAVEA